MPVDPRFSRTAAFGVIAVLLGSFVLLELSARVYLFGLAGLHPLRIDSMCSAFESGMYTSSPDPEIGFELRPNLDRWFQLARLRTNSRGLRYRELEPEKPEGVFRAVVMGSSFTFPAGVEIEDAFHARLDVIHGQLRRVVLLSAIDAAIAVELQDLSLATLGRHHGFPSAQGLVVHRRASKRPAPSHRPCLPPCVRDGRIRA